MREYDFTDTRVWLRDFWVYVYSQHPAAGGEQGRDDALNEICRLADEAGITF